MSSRVSTPSLTGTDGHAINSSELKILATISKTLLQSNAFPDLKPEKAALLFKTLLYGYTTSSPEQNGMPTCWPGMVISKPMVNHVIHKD
jgi:hypothetical protein